MGGSRSNNESNCPFSSSCSSDDKLSVTVGGCEGVLCVCVSGRGGGGGVGMSSVGGVLDVHIAMKKMHAVHVDLGS